MNLIETLAFQRSSSRKAAGAGAVDVVGTAVEVAHARHSDVCKLAASVAATSSALRRDAKAVIVEEITGRPNGDDDVIGFVGKCVRAEPTLKAAWSELVHLERDTAAAARARENNATRAAMLARWAGADTPAEADGPPVPAPPPPTARARAEQRAAELHKLADNCSPEMARAYRAAEQATLDEAATAERIAGVVTGEDLAVAERFELLAKGVNPDLRDQYLNAARKIRSGEMKGT